MKIKAVCEATGLTDRTVRYYIEEELISPVYTENYLGRKTLGLHLRYLCRVAIGTRSVLRGDRPSKSGF